MTGIHISNLDVIKPDFRRGNEHEVGTLSDSELNIQGGGFLEDVGNVFNDIIE
jgi:hypothetical protein